MSGHRTYAGYRSNAGFSLVELMVSLVISLIVLAAVSSVMVSSKKANTAETAQARMQDNARIALQIMARDIRQAGYFGCSTGISSNNFHNDLNSTSNGQLDLSTGLEGANGSYGGTSADTTLYPLGNTLPTAPAGGALVSGSDIINARYADGAGSLGIQAPYMNQASDAIHVSASNGLKIGDILMVTDCNGGDIFQLTNMTAGSNSSQVSLVHQGGNGSPGNAGTGALSRTYSSGANIATFVSNTYFVATNTRGEPALYRWCAGCTKPQELVDGIEQIRVLYGVDTTNDGSANCYIKAGASCTTPGAGTVDLSTPAGWSKVYSVRLGVLARTLANNTIRGDKQSASASQGDLDTRTYDILGDGTYTFTPSGSDSNYQHHVFRTTVMVRNHP